MVNYETNELFFDNLQIPEKTLIGEEGKGFKYILTDLNAERTLIAAECIGDGYWFTDHMTKYVSERKDSGRTIDQNQGIQFPIAEAFIEIAAAKLMRYDACRRYDAGEECGAQANMAKYLSAKASWEAANACIQIPPRLRLCMRVRHRAQIPRNAPLSGRANFDQPDPVLCCRA